MRPQGVQDALGLLGRLGGGDESPVIFQSDLEHLAGVVGILDDQDMDAVKIPVSRRAS
jgi:hypothetical protein